MDDATSENGCLWVIPGSHRRGIIWPTSEIDDDRYDCAQGSVDFPYTDEDGVMVPAKAGSVVFFNGYLLHRSLPNYAESGFRRSLVHHYMSAESLLLWRPPAQAYTMATADVRDIVMVAGKDPYAYKGIDQSIFFSHVRPQKEGGCRWPTATARRWGTRLPQADAHVRSRELRLRRPCGRRSDSLVHSGSGFRHHSQSLLDDFGGVAESKEERKTRRQIDAAGKAPLQHLSDSFFILCVRDRRGHRAGLLQSRHEALTGTS